MRRGKGGGGGGGGELNDWFMFQTENIRQPRVVLDFRGEGCCVD